MSLIGNIPSKSPKLHPLHLLNPKNIASSPRKLIMPYPDCTISINSPRLQFKEKHLQQVNLSYKCKSNYGSPERTRALPTRTPKSSNIDIKLKLDDYKLKISRIQELLFGDSTSQKQISHVQQPVKKFSGDRSIIEKIHYKSDQISLSCSSDSKSMTSNTSTQVTRHDGSYKRLSINGQQEIFRVLRFINEGCYGKVHLVQHVATNFICCLKTITKNGLNAQIKEQITREIMIQSFLSHPNIVAIYGHCHDEDNVYLLLEACMGGNLFQKMEGAELGEKEVANTVRQACRALDFMHSNDIIHRDIKPENILLHQGTAKICDFGWAVHSPLLRSTQCGTPLYLSPQVIQSDLYDSKVDVWSIGILTYQLLFRKIPFDIKFISDLSKIVSEGITFKGREVSSEAKEFILRCLSKNPRDRLTIEQALEHKYLIRDNSKFRQTIN